MKSKKWILWKSKQIHHKSIFMLHCNKIDIDLAIHRMTGGFTEVISKGARWAWTQPSTSSLDLHVIFCIWKILLILIKNYQFNLIQNYRTIWYNLQTLNADYDQCFYTSFHYQELYSNGTHDLLSRQKMSKFSTFSRKYSIPISIFRWIMT